MTLAKKLVQRTVTVLDLGDITTTILIPDSVVFRHKHEKTGHTHYLDVTSFCYTKRSAQSGIIGNLVDPTSLVLSRLSTARDIIDFIRGQAYERAKTHKAIFSSFLQWVDSNYSEIDFLDRNNWRSVYVTYTAHLIQRLNLPPRAPERLAATVATNYQKGACKFISIATGEDERVIKLWATKLRKSMPGIAGPGTPSATEQDISFAAHIQYVDEVHRVIFKKENFPLVLTSQSDEDYFLYDDIGFRKQKNVKLMYGELTKFPALPTMEALITGSPELSRLSQNSKNDAYAILRAKVLISNSEYRNPYRARNLVITALTAGLLSFIAATGGNLSPVADLRPTDFKPIPTSKGRRFLGIKSRAGGKRVEPEFGAKYSSTYNKILDLRQWLLGKTESALLFPFPRRSGEYGQILYSHIQSYKHLLHVFLPNVVWVTPAQFRKNVSYQYLKISDGDTLLTAQKLGNTVSTVQTHYGRPALEDVAKEFTFFFDAIQKAAIARGRNQSTIPVTIIQPDATSIEIPGGSCMSAEGLPSIAKGFNSLSPVPSCREPEYCVFCKHYAIHADETDIKRLLSIKFIISVTQQYHDPEQWTERLSPLQYRIDEILEAISMKLVDANLIDRIQAEVECGELDPFWAVHLDALVHIGYVS